MTETAFADRVRTLSAPQDEDQLARLRRAVAEVRDHKQVKQDLEERLKAVNQAIYAAEHEALPNLFNAARCTDITIEPEGNMPGFTATKGPYYKANISADWPIERQEKAFQWLADHKHSDVIKTVITIELGRGERLKARKLESILRKEGIDYNRRLGVPWNTLTSLIKECYQSNKPLSIEELETLGASVGEVVVIKAVT